MIRLKTLLQEAADDLKPKLRVLFVGDSEVIAPYSFANQLTKTLDIKSTIVGFKNASSLQIYKLVKSKLPQKKIRNSDNTDDSLFNSIFDFDFDFTESGPTYDIITIMAGGSDGAPGKQRRAIRDLQLAFELAKESGAKLVAISNATKSYLQTDDALYKDHGYPSNDAIGVWVNNQTISDAVIDVNSMPKNKFASDNVQLSPNAHRDIANEWKSIISNFNLNIIPKEKSDGDITTMLPVITYDTITGNYNSSILDQAIILMTGFEGFLATAMWDVNNWRIGYGSSTVTMKDGKVIELPNKKNKKPNITITSEDASRDLQRRLVNEFIPRTISQLGDAANTLSNGTIAALVSVAYNYGSLPRSVVLAAKSKNINLLIDAVRALTSNISRRNKEADYIANAEAAGKGSGEQIQYTTGENADAMKIMTVLINKGLSVAGAAGVAGNMKIESNFKTAILGDKGTSIGLVQWHDERKDKLISWAKQNGYDPVSTNGQLEYLWWELGTSFSKLKSDLKIIQDPQAAAYQFAKEFERPKNISANRSAYAQQYFNEYNSATSNKSSIVNKDDEFSGTKTIVIGDSITPHLAKAAGFSPGPQARGTGDYSGVGLWFGGIGLSSLQKMAAGYKTVHLDVKNVVITIGTNGYGGTGGVGGLATNLKRIFPNANLFVCQGAYGPRWKSTKYPHLANYTDQYMISFYNAFAAAGITVVPYPIKDTVLNVHTPSVPVYKKWGSYINSHG